MPNFRDAFPDFDYDLPSVPLFDDVSGKNDTCPSLFSRVLGLKIFCDYADPAMREERAPVRYTLHLASPWGDAIDEHGIETSGATDDALIATDDWDAVLAAIETHRARPDMARRIEIATIAMEAGFRIEDGTNGDSCWSPVDKGEDAPFCFESAIGHTALPTPEQEAAGWRVGTLQWGSRPDSRTDLVPDLQQAIETAQRRQESAAAPRI